MTEDGGVYWIDKGGEVPAKGANYAGQWYPGKLDANGKQIPPSHPNARFTLSLKSLDTVDPKLEDPSGVEVGAMVYGGRDSDTGFLSNRHSTGSMVLLRKEPFLNQRRLLRRSDKWESEKSIRWRISIFCQSQSVNISR